MPTCLMMSRDLGERVGHFRDECHLNLYLLTALHLIISETHKSQSVEIIQDLIDKQHYFQTS